MCGIAGFIDPGPMEFEQRMNLLDTMCRVISYRGPDDQGVFINGNAALGMRRLSIIDLAGGHQPISNEDGSITVVFNGEIYNFKELQHILKQRGHYFRTDSDTEVIAHAYEEYGTDCVTYFRGMFAFALWDKRFETLVLARDRVGKKPLHYFSVGNTLVFGSEIKSLLHHPAVERKVNLEAIADYLTFGYIPDPATAFQGVAKLPPGYILTFTNGRLSSRPYWDFTYSGEGVDTPPAQAQDYIERLQELLKEAVRIRLVSDVPLGAFLSGGIDSSTVVAMMSAASTQPVKTFSIGFTEGSHDELEYARMTASRFRTDHHEFVVTPDVCQLVEEIVWHHDEPFADISSIPTYIVSKMASEHVKVVLSGDGGDELFAGYERYVVDRRRQIYDTIPVFLKRHVLGPLSEALPNRAYGKNYLRAISLDSDVRYINSLCLFGASAQNQLLSTATQEELKAHDSIRSFRELYAIPKSSERIDHLLYLDSKTYLPGDILTKVDRMSMAHSLETRAPFLDHKLIEFVQAIPASLKLQKQDTKHILKCAVRGIIPDPIIYREKHGFSVPIAKWLRREMRELVHDTLTDRTTARRGLFNQFAIVDLLREHQSGRRDNSRQLWALLMLELWFRSFIDRVPMRTFEGVKWRTMRRLTSAG